MNTKISIVNCSVLKSWSIYLNHQIKHNGKLNPASIRYRKKCVERLKKLFPDAEISIVNY